MTEFARNVDEVSQTLPGAARSFVSASTRSERGSTLFVEERYRTPTAARVMALTMPTMARASSAALGNISRSGVLPVWA